MFSINQSLAETNDNYSTTVATIQGGNITDSESLQKQTMPSKIVAATTPLARLMEIPTLSFGLKGIGRFTGKKGKGKGTTPAPSSKGGGKKHKGEKMKKKVTASHHTTEYVPEKQMEALDFDARRLGHRKHQKGKAKGHAKTTTPKAGVTRAENITMTKGKHASKIAASSTPFAQLKEIPTLGFAAVLHSTTDTSEASDTRNKSSESVSSTVPTTTALNTSGLNGTECVIAVKDVANADYKNDSITDERIQKRH